MKKLTHLYIAAFLALSCLSITVSSCGNFTEEYTDNSTTTTTDKSTSWELVTSSASWGNRSEHSVVAYNNKLWLMDGYINSSTKLNYVWYSSDGSNWTQATSSAEWSASNILNKQFE